MIRWVSIVIGLSCFLSTAQALVPAVERDALIALYNNTNGDGWTRSNNWLEGDPCSGGFWQGITCNEVDTNIVSIQLNDNNLVGSIPAELGNLSKLDYLELSDNLQLIGSIPPELGNLSNLTALWLTRNQLSGSIPAELGNLSNLQSLGLNQNQLSGSIPASLENLSNLRGLSLFSNQLSGSIPPELGNLTNLTHLQLGWNQLSGSIPTSLGNLSNLLTFEFHYNQLSGSIPNELGNLSNLQSLYLRNNHLNGSIPAELGSLRGLSVLHLAENQLNGSIPPEFGNMVSLWELYLYDNQLSGSIPAELGNLVNLRRLNAWDNHLIGSIPTELGNLINLQELGLNGNKLSGYVPVELENLSNLYYLDLSFNALFTTDESLDFFLDGKSKSDWSSTQTVAPQALQVSSVDINSVTLAWNPIEYTANDGGYRVWYAISSGGPYLDKGITLNKSMVSHTVSGLDDGESHYFVVTTETNSHASNANIVVSDNSNEVFITPDDASFQINSGLNDAWFNPATDGQGFFITVFPDLGAVSLAWFTYDTELPPLDATANLGDPGHRWLTAVGPIVDDQAIMEIEMTSGGIFDTVSEITRTDPPGSDGTIILTFTSCNSGTIEYDIPSINRQGIVPIQRVADDNIALCELLSNN